MAQERHRFPEAYEVAEEMGIDYCEAKSCFVQNLMTLSLNAPVGGQEDVREMIDLLESELPSPELQFEEADIRRRISKIFGLLNENESKVIIMYFGIGRDAPMTLDEIGRTIGVTRERVRQIKETAINKIRRSNLIESLRA